MLNTPLQMLIVAMAGWVSEQQLTVIEYLREENRVLREQLGHKRLRFTDDQRRQLAAKGKVLGRTINQRRNRACIGPGLVHSGKVES